MDGQLNQDDEFYCVVRHITLLSSAEFSLFLTSFTPVFLLSDMLCGICTAKSEICHPRQQRGAGVSRCVQSLPAAIQLYI